MFYKGQAGLHTVGGYRYTPCFNACLDIWESKALLLFFDHSIQLQHHRPLTNSYFLCESFTIRVTGRDVLHRTRNVRVAMTHTTQPDRPGLRPTTQGEATLKPPRDVPIHVHVSHDYSMK